MQSAVSQQIALLERLVGVRLVERSRGPKPVSMTEAGELLLGHVESILSRLRAAQTDLDALINGDARALRVGVYQSVSARIMPALLSTLGARWPDIELSMRECGADCELFGEVADGRLDAAFAELPVEPGPFDCEPLVRDPYVLVVHVGSPIAQSERVNPRELSGLALIGHDQSRSAQRIETELRARGIEPTIVFRSDMTTTVQALVSAGIAAAILPRLAVDSAYPNTKVLELMHLLTPRTIGVFWHRERAHGPALDAFREAAREVGDGLQTATGLTLEPRAPTGTGPERPALRG